jgi:Ohr subfamily peroxiredoxin
MSKIQKVLVTGKTRTTGADSQILSGNHQGKLNLNLTVPGHSSAPSYQFKEIGNHPAAEQLFAGAWSACYIGSVGIVAAQKKVSLPADTAVEIEVDLGAGGSEYFLQARINLIVPGVPRDVALAIAHGADEMCPYSKATRGNIDVVLNVVTD